ncbi:hypothetical protein [Oceanobacillus alkalisoli]|nr:hypothetical protein [Oceanobacillus alkalisoli]
MNLTKHAVNNIKRFADAMSKGLVKAGEGARSLRVKVRREKETNQ